MIHVMYNIEPIYFSLHEYKKYEETRLPEAKLAVNGTYMAMIKLAANRDRLEAVRFPIKICRLDPTLYSGTVSPLDVDLQETFKASAHFKNGYWTNVATEIELPDSNDRPISTKSSYLTSYTGLEGIGLNDLEQELILASPELLSVGSTTE